MVCNQAFALSGHFFNYKLSNISHKMFYLQLQFPRLRNDGVHIHEITQCFTGILQVNLCLPVGSLL